MFVTDIYLHFINIIIAGRRTRNSGDSLDDFDIGKLETLFSPLFSWLSWLIFKETRWWNIYQVWII